MAITLDNHVKAETNNSASLTSSAITTAATGGPLFVAVNVGQGTVGIADSKTNTWIVGASQNFNGTNGITHFWYVQNATGGTGNTFTGTQSGGAGPQFLVASFLGCALSGGLNASNFTELAGSTAAVTAPSVTTTVAGCLIVTVLVGGAPTLITPTSANGSVTDAFSTNGNNVSGALSWFVAGAPGSYSDTLTFAGQTAFDYAMYTMAFAPASSGASITCAAGSFAMTGEAATLSQGSNSGNFTLLANAGAFDFTGASSSSDIQTDAAAGLFAFTGKQAGLPGSPITSGGPGLFRRRHHKFVQGH